MRLTVLTIFALLSQWRKSPFQLVLMVLSLSIASALWSGVSIINKQARVSYDKAGSLFERSKVPLIVSSEKNYFSDSLFGELRTAGILVSPLISGSLRIATRNYEVLGVDLVSQKSNYLGFLSNSNRFLEFIQPPYKIIVNDLTRKNLFQHSLFPEIEINNSLADDTIIMDISAAQNLLNKKGLISRLELYSPEYDVNQSFLTKNSLTILSSDSGEDFEKLTRSFHLNLSAFGFLSFVVGIFIFYSAINLAFEQKRKIVHLLSVIGISKSIITVSIFTELLLIGSIGGILGSLLGYFLALLLLPDVSGTLRGVFGVPMKSSIVLPWSLWLINFIIVICGVLAASLSYQIKIHKAALISRNTHNVSVASSQKSARLLSYIGILILLVGFIFFYFFSQSLELAFSFLGCFLIGFTLLLPMVLLNTITFLSFFTRSITAKWFFSETKTQSHLLNIALMAIVLAFSINIGVSGMVNSFKDTFTSWLDQRLAAEIYLRVPSQKYSTNVLEFSEANGGEVLPIYGTNLRVHDYPSTIYAFKPHATYRKHWPLMQCLKSCWDDIEANNGWLINEQLARKLNVEIGENLVINLPVGNLEKKVSAIYSDYGNPKMQLMVPIDFFIENYPQLKPTTYAVRVNKKKINSFISAAKMQFPFDGSWITDQNSVKIASLEIFDKTFSITNSLSILTLIIAGLAVFSTLVTIGEARRSQLAPAWAMGITKLNLACQEFLRSLILAIVSIMFAIPLGVAISFILTKYVNVSAFGWELPISIHLNDWVKLSSITISILTISILAPLLRNNIKTTQSFLRTFNNE